MQQKPEILIIEDEEPIIQGLTDVFIFHGYRVETAMDGQKGLKMATEGRYALILLDVMLPSIDGFCICNRIRERDRNQPIIMLTAKSAEDDIINGLSLGADDYITKPFSVRELVLRVEAVLKRSQGLSYDSKVIEVGHIKIDCFNLIQMDSPAPKKFTRREISILQYLLLHAERPVPRDELLEKVWGFRRADSIETRTVDIHIAKLRRKIEPDPGQPQFLVTVRGEGYRLRS